MNSKVLGFGVAMITKKQFDKFKKIVSYAYENSQFYNEHYKINKFHPSMLKNLEDYLKVPVVRREQLKKITPDEILTTSDRSRLISQNTSGSSGINVKIFYSKFEKYINFWSCLKSYFINRQKLRDITVALRDPVDIKKPNLIQRLGFLRYDYYNVFDPIEDNYKAIVKKYHRIDILKGMPSDLASLALCAQKEGGFPDVGIIYSDCEVLDESNRAFIENVFNTKVVNYYASVECGMIAYENINKLDGGMEVNGDFVHISPKEDKQIDKAIVTNLYNFTYPIIRYEIGDVIEFENYGTDNFSIKKVFGKYLDFILLKDNSIISPHTIKQALTHLEGVSRFRVIQQSIDQIEITLESNGDISPDLEKAIRKEVGVFTNDTCEIVIKTTDKFVKTNYRKFKVVESKVAQEFLGKVNLPKAG